MLELRGNIWTLAQFDKEVDAVVITTNGYVKKASGECVMGRGIALEAKRKFPQLPKRLGDLITEYGNIPFPLSFYSVCNYHILSFPTKHVWWDNSDIELIKASCKAITMIADQLNLNRILMPRPGCGNGGLTWEYVKPHIENLLDDRFIVVTF